MHMARVVRASIFDFFFIFFLILGKFRLSERALVIYVYCFFLCGYLFLELHYLFHERCTRIPCEIIVEYFGPYVFDSVSFVDWVAQTSRQSAQRLRFCDLRENRH